MLWTLRKRGLDSVVPAASVRPVRAAVEPDLKQCQSVVPVNCQCPPRFAAVALCSVTAGAVPEVWGYDASG